MSSPLKVRRDALASSCAMWQHRSSTMIPASFTPAAEGKGYLTSQGLGDFGKGKQAHTLVNCGTVLKCRRRPHKGPLGSMMQQTYQYILTSICNLDDEIYSLSDWDPKEASLTTNRWGGTRLCVHLLQLISDDATAPKRHGQ